MSAVKNTRRNKIKMRIRKTIVGTTDRPRVSVFRSNKEIYAQIVDDSKGVTLISASTREKSLSSAKGTKTELASAVGKALAKKALEAGIEHVTFDRNGYLYHGRVKALADAAREGGLKF
jgi:large subunit ribosomal protein L18